MNLEQQQLHELSLQTQNVRIELQKIRPRTFGSNRALVRAIVALEDAVTALDAMADAVGMADMPDEEPS